MGRQVPVKLIVVDPGKASGVVCASITDGRWTGYTLDFEQTGQLLEEQTPSCDAVVMETFRINANTAKKTQAPWSLELIGVGRYFASKCSVPFVLQTPADAKAFCTDHRLKQLELWRRGDTDHVRDALRHLVVFCARNLGSTWYDDLRRLTRMEDG
jgi:hypothetical protein